MITRQEEILVVANQCVTEENPPWLRKGEEVKVLTETLKKHCDSLSSKLNKKEGKSSKLNIRNIDKRMEWKKNLKRKQGKKIQLVQLMKNQK